MHYVLETVGPMDRAYLTHVVLRYLRYPGYLPPARFNAGGGSAAQKHLLGMPSPIGRPIHGAGPGHAGPLPGMGNSRLVGSPVGPVAQGSATLNFSSQSSASVDSRSGHARHMERPAALQLGTVLTIQPGITIREINDLGRWDQDLFLWEAHHRPAMLSVTNRGAHYDWRELPLGWNNPQWAYAPPADLGGFRPGQPVATLGGVARMSTAQKVGQAMWRALKMVPQDVADIIGEMMRPANIGKILLVESLYAGSMFLGVGEVATLALVLLGAYYVGEEVLAFLDNLQAFVKAIQKAQTEEDLNQAARLFADLMKAGISIARAIFTRSRSHSHHEPSSVFRMKAKGGAGGKRPATHGSSGEGGPAGKAGKGKPAGGASGSHPPVPDGWTAKPSKKGGGTVYQDPTNPHNSIRIMPGNPNSPNPAQQGPYVIYKKNGVAYDANGKPLPNADHPDAHIPLGDYDPNKMPKF